MQFIFFKFFEKFWSSFYDACDRIFVRFALSLTVSEISTFKTKMAKSATFQNFGKFEFFGNFEKCCAVIIDDACDPKLSSVSLYL